MKFKQFFEATDIFGFDADRAGDKPDDNMLARPICQFNLELMMDLLAKKNIGNKRPHMKFVNEMSWGNETGDMRIFVDTGYTFYIQKRGKDKLGESHWITKKIFQLNRQGYGGLEDIVCNEIHDELVKAHESPIDSTINDYNDLENLTQKIYNKMKKVMKHIFIPEGIKQLSDNAYIIKLGVKGHGVQEMDQRRVEQNQTLVSYDPERGTINITNYNLSSRVGGPHDWKIGTKDLDVMCMPSQSRDEISEIVAVNMKYY